MLSVYVKSKLMSDAYYGQMKHVFGFNEVLYTLNLVPQTVRIATRIYKEIYRAENLIKLFKEDGSECKN